MTDSGGGRYRSAITVSLPLSGKGVKQDMIPPLAVPINKTAITPSLPLPLEVFANGPVPNLGPPRGEGESNGWGTERFPSAPGPTGPRQVEGGSPGDPPCPD